MQKYPRPAPHWIYLRSQTVCPVFRRLSRPHCPSPGFRTPENSPCIPSLGLSGEVPASIGSQRERNGSSDAPSPTLRATRKPARKISTDGRTRTCARPLRSAEPLLLHQAVQADQRRCAPAGKQDVRGDAVPLGDRLPQRLDFPEFDQFRRDLLLLQPQRFGFRLRLGDLLFGLDLDPIEVPRGLQRELLRLLLRLDRVRELLGEAEVDDRKTVHVQVVVGELLAQGILDRGADVLPIADQENVSTA